MIVIVECNFKFLILNSVNHPVWQVSRHEPPIGDESSLQRLIACSFPSFAELTCDHCDGRRLSCTLHTPHGRLYMVELFLHDCWPLGPSFERSVELHSCGSISLKKLFSAQSLESSRNFIDL